jgi:hypothetical protein
MIDGWFPTAPPESPERTGVREVHLRYEDVRQTGFLSPTAAPFAIGEVFWRGLLLDSPMLAYGRENAILPILARAVVVGGEGPIDVTAPVVARATYQLQRAPGEGPSADRLYLNIWGSIEAPIGRTNFPPPDDAGRRVVAARVFLEHVFTRPFAPREERKVTRFDDPRMPEVATLTAYAPPSDEDLLRPPAAPIEAGWDDPAPFVFGFDHTDSNHHVNSLVHPRIFSESASRRAFELGRKGLGIAALEIAYRKPFFAGERACLRIGLAEAEGGLAAWGTLRGDGESRPRCTVRARLVG